jgi:hypothetical protein
MVKERIRQRGSARDPRVSLSLQSFFVMAANDAGDAASGCAQSALVLVAESAGKIR